MNTKGLFFPISIVSGEYLEVPFEFFLDGAMQSFDDYDFHGVVRQKGGVHEELTFTFSEDSENAERVLATISDTNDIVEGEYAYEVIVLPKNNPSRRRSLLFGSFTVMDTLIGGI